MSEQQDSISDDLSTYGVDAEDQLQPEDTLIDEGVEDVLDKGYSPPDVDRVSGMVGLTATEQREGETIEQRIRQEIPDPDSAYGAPDDESGMAADSVGGDDPDAIPAEQDWLGDAEVGDERAGRLVAPDEGAAPDAEAGLVGDDLGVDGGDASPEESAMHVVRSVDADAAVAPGTGLIDSDVDLDDPQSGVDFRADLAGDPDFGDVPDADAGDLSDDGVESVGGGRSADELDELAAGDAEPGTPREG